MQTLAVDVDVEMDMSSAAYHGGQQTKQTVHQARPEDRECEATAKSNTQGPRSRSQQLLRRHANVAATSRSVAVSEKKPGQIQAKSESKTTFAARSICGNAILSLFMDLAAHATCTPAKRTSDVAAVSVDVAVAAMLLLPRLLRSPLLLQHPPL